MINLRLRIEGTQFEKLSCREFDPQTTLNQIVEVGRDKVQLWKIDYKLTSFVNEDDETMGIMFKLNHNYYSDMILITLNFMDYYDVHFFNREIQMTHKITDVPCECLYDTINDYINKPIHEFQMNLN